ncbi:hypothetical protein JTB14_013658 [Gonioctena quinquepunctata]|nr:hypothetical protein JTB14_013658 [Gonioctena quinquepunctata]
MVLTQFGFMAYQLVRSEAVGIHDATEEEWQAFLHVWRVVGYLMGIEDRFNLCSGTVQETREICNLLIDQVYRPEIEKRDEDFLTMTRYLCAGLWAMNPVLRFKTAMCILHNLVQKQNGVRKVPEPTYFKLSWGLKLNYYYQVKSSSFQIELNKMSLPETYVPGFHDETAVRKMKYNKLGTTDMNVSELSLGTGGFSYFYGEFDISECKKTVHEAIRNGINFIDSAPWYGHGVAEEILGKCLEGIPRKAYYLATKVGRYEKDPKLMFDFSAKKTKESIDASLKRLGLDYVDVLQVHDIEFSPSMETILNETLPTVAEIVKEGKARYIGITGYPVATLLECIEQSTTQIHTILSYCRLTMIDDSLKSFIPKLKSRNIGIINGAANSMGLLSNFGPQEWHPACQEIKDICSKVRELCKENNVELGKLAVYYSLQQDGPETVLVGMNSTKLLEYNLNVLINGLTPLEQEVYEKVLKIFENITVKHWENFELENYWKLMKGGESLAGFFK